MKEIELRKGKDSAELADDVQKEKFLREGHC